MAWPRWSTTRRASCTGRFGGLVHGFHSVGHLNPAATGATAWIDTARERQIG
ncbi:hypothetical protein [Streptomyces sp. NPDC053720]|uniref:hypothetical protein n=1 Tax=Streptomyces sp. NPDC053720 TaxID=3154855 RepID=UPI00341E3149